MADLDPVYCDDDWPHDWERDEDRRGEGLVCARCGVTEAEVHGDDYID